MPSMFILVKDIKPQYQLRAVHVRVVRVFKVPEKRGEGNSSKSTEVILHDEEGSYIHASIQKKGVVKYREIFKEGKLFEIKNFMAATNYYVYKITQHAYMIKLNYRTEVKEINSLGFPFKMFRLKSFISLKDTADVNDKELIDVIGRVIEINNHVDKIIGGKATKLIDFQIEDNLAGISDFKSAGLIVTTCYDLKKTQVDGEYYVAAEILGLDLDDGWYYVSCMSAGCNKKLKEDGGSLVCTKCHKPYTQGTVRYKVVIMALDKSGDAPLLLWDREVAELADVEVPPELDAIVGMKILFKVGLKLALKRGNNSPFSVLRMLRDEHLVQTYSDRFVEHQEQDLISKMLEEETNSAEASIGVEVNSPASMQPSQHELDDTAVNSLTTKRSLLDEFSSSKSRKKATPSNIKKEKTA
ncbi:PREDICTED: uncharacterized protein LOC109187893 [Ipomoea nil]|uniref:uncharacterized protein LOC109187893 n=1 Tax=Ipomoea nil TaxID=35883 RepID=UPI0009008860|nr:PREDICTED: uncharacterized protein LOC109187893 [Ipomoea nil]